jgi:hypothetical protein
MTFSSLSSVSRFSHRLRKQRKRADIIMFVMSATAFVLGRSRSSYPDVTLAPVPYTIDRPILARIPFPASGLT